MSINYRNIKNLIDRVRLGDENLYEALRRLDQGIIDLSSVFGVEVDIDSVAFNSLSPTTTVGDLIYHNGSTNVRLPIGTAGFILTVSGGIPVWQTPVVVNLSGWTDDGTVVRLTTVTDSVGIGTTAPKGAAVKLHIANGTNADTNWDIQTVVVIERTDHVTLNIRTPNNKQGQIVFSDPDATFSGLIVYNHNNDQLAFYAAGVVQAYAHSTGLNVASNLYVTTAIDAGGLISTSAGITAGTTIVATGAITGGGVTSVGAINAQQRNMSLSNGDNHNVALGGYSHQRLAGGVTAAFAITGFAGGVNGQIIFLINVTGQVCTLKHNNAGSSAGNKLWLYGGADLVTNRAVFCYSTADGLWFQYL